MCNFRISLMMVKWRRLCGRVDRLFVRFVQCRKLDMRLDLRSIMGAKYLPLSHFARKTIQINTLTVTYSRECLFYTSLVYSYSTPIGRNHWHTRLPPLPWMCCAPASWWCHHVYACEPHGPFPVDSSVYSYSDGMYLKTSISGLNNNSHPLIQI
jgi:hypothetical protein